MVSCKCFRKPIQWYRYIIFFLGFNRNTWGHRSARDVSGPRARQISSLCGSGTQTTEGTLVHSDRPDLKRLIKQGRNLLGTNSDGSIPLSYAGMGAHFQCEPWKQFCCWKISTNIIGILNIGVFLLWVLFSFLCCYPFYHCYPFTFSHRISNCPPKR
jgi:hypothetical protein